MHKELLFHKALCGHGGERITGIYLFSKLVKVTISQASQ